MCVGKLRKNPNFAKKMHNFSNEKLSPVCLFFLRKKYIQSKKNILNQLPTGLIHNFNLVNNSLLSEPFCTSLKNREFLEIISSLVTNNSQITFRIAKKIIIGLKNYHRKQNILHNYNYINRNVSEILVKRILF